MSKIKKSRIKVIHITNNSNENDVEVIPAKIYATQPFCPNRVKLDTSRVYLKKPEVDVPRLGVIPKTRRGVYSSYGRVPIEVWLKKS